MMTKPIMCRRCNKRIAIYNGWCDQCFTLEWEDYKEEHNVK
jgi:hypothetical protein